MNYDNYCIVPIPVIIALLYIFNFYTKDQTNTFNIFKIHPQKRIIC